MCACQLLSGKHGQALPHVLLLHVLLFTLHKGAQVVHFKNILSYNVMALGNYEFYNGAEGLIGPFLKQAKFPILSANIKAKGPQASQIANLHLPYKNLFVGGEIVGIIVYT